MKIEDQKGPNQGQISILESKSIGLNPKNKRKIKGELMI
jgi:hypothetical protein